MYPPDEQYCYSSCYPYVCPSGYSFVFLTTFVDAYVHSAFSKGFYVLCYKSHVCPCICCFCEFFLLVDLVVPGLVLWSSPSLLALYVTVFMAWVSALIGCTHFVSVVCFLFVCIPVMRNTNRKMYSVDCWIVVRWLLKGIRHDRPVVTPSVPLTGASVSVRSSDLTQVGSSSFKSLPFLFVVIFVSNLCCAWKPALPIHCPKS